MITPNYLKAFATALIVARRHRFMIDEKIVQPARARQANLQRSIKNAGRPMEQIARMIEGNRLYEFLRADAGPAGEKPLKMRRA